VLVAAAAVSLSKKEQLALLSAVVIAPFDACHVGLGGPEGFSRRKRLDLKRDCVTDGNVILGEQAPFTSEASGTPICSTNS
jgi:hypothetical protein